MKHYNRIGSLFGGDSVPLDRFLDVETQLGDTHPFLPIQIAIEAVQHGYFAILQDQLVGSLRESEPVQYYAALLKEIKSVKSYVAILQDIGQIFILHMKAEDHKGAEIRFEFVLRFETIGWKIEDIAEIRHDDK